ncbi:hypothetical protein SAMN02910356_00330 [Selenomonas sp. GACV-9]|uniref:hypothetical protein n=1 Tax=Selenomonas sp. GACV-9 TaxID=3158782 RepID=UPI0008E8AF58|nr:hypothetical protein SAMN02910356_00330 [Selenomonas ruminantium]
MSDLAINADGYDVSFRGHKYHFSERKFYDENFSVQLPDSFTVMPERVREIYLPGSKPGQLLLADEAGQFSFSMLKAEDPLDAAILEKQVDLCKFVLPKMAAGVHIYEAGVVEGFYQPLAYFEYISDGLLERMYSCMFLTGLEGHMVWGTISFSYSDRKLNKLAKEIACSCQDLTMNYANLNDG